MKYIALVAVAAFIIFTAWFSKRTEELTIGQMNKMNNLISQYMTQAVQNNQPNATEIEFSNISTEVIESGRKMKAHFKFSYMEPNSDGDMEKVYRKGTFLITSEDGKQWKAQIEEAGDVKIEFMEPFQVDDSGDSSSNSTSNRNNQVADASDSAQSDDQELDTDSSSSSENELDTETSNDSDNENDSEAEDTSDQETDPDNSDS